MKKMEENMDFIDFNIFTKKNILKSREILKNLFLIDFNEEEETFHTIIDLGYEKFVKRNGKYKGVKVSDKVKILKIKLNNKTEYKKWKRKELINYFEEVKQTGDIEEKLLKIHEIYIYR